jgi:hypothetical protein
MKFLNNEIVEYKLPSDGVKRIGAIRGQVNTGYPVIGIDYIVEDLSGDFPNETYRYSCLVVSEIHINSNE